MPIDLAMEVLDSKSARDAQLDADVLLARFNDAGKVTVLATQMMWIIGNVPGLLKASVIFATTITTPAPFLESYSAIANLPQAPAFDIPRSIEQWIEAQADDPTCLDGIPADDIVEQDGLLLHITEEFEPRIIVPTAPREALIRQHHADIFHLGPDKTTTPCGSPTSGPSWKQRFAKC
jgi:hypothetical protein